MSAYATDASCPSATTPLKSREIVDVSGLVVAPGFIDLHSHAQNLPGHRLQALDGVTTTLELEAGALPVADYYEAATAEGRPLNFGYSAGWVHARMSVLDDVADADPLHDPTDRLGMSTFEKFQDGPRWRYAADDSEVDRILTLVREADRSRRDRRRRAGRLRTRIHTIRT
jgi:hypothetical protein